MKLLLLFLILPYHQLTWSDFKGKQTDITVVAQVDCGTMLITDYLGGRYFFKVETIFNPDQSFTTSHEDYILEHEQGHLSIAEYFTRLTRKAIEPYQGRGGDVTHIVDSIFASYAVMRDNTQEAYDCETGHSVNKENQERWNRWIAEQLKY